MYQREYFDNGCTPTIFDYPSICPKSPLLAPFISFFFIHGPYVRTLSLWESIYAKRAQNYDHVMAYTVWPMYFGKQKNNNFKLVTGREDQRLKLIFHRHDIISMANVKQCHVEFFFLDATHPFGQRLPRGCKKWTSLKRYHNIGYMTHNYILSHILCSENFDISHRHQRNWYLHKNDNYFFFSRF